MYYVDRRERDHTYSYSVKQGKANRFPKGQQVEENWDLRVDSDHSGKRGGGEIPRLGYDHIRKPPLPIRRQPVGDKEDQLDSLRPPLDPHRPPRHLQHVSKPHQLRPDVPSRKRVALTHRRESPQSPGESYVGGVRTYRPDRLASGLPRRGICKGPLGVVRDPGETGPGRGGHAGNGKGAGG